MVSGQPYFRRNIDMTIETHGITDEADTGTADAGQNLESQVEKTFTQAELNDIVAKRVHQVNSKYAGIDVEEYKALKGLKEQLEEEQLIKKQDFDGVLKKQREKADGEIATLRSELESIKIDGALINASSKAKALSPDHVAQLLRKNVRLDETGKVIVLDAEGKPRYTDAADPMTVEQLVDEFLSSNQYFRTAGPSGAGSTGNTNTASDNDINLAQLDLSKPEHREIYKKLKATGKV